MLCVHICNTTQNDTIFILNCFPDGKSETFFILGTVFFKHTIDIFAGMTLDASLQTM